MRAAVTGSSGFVGRYLCAHLRDLGDEVATIDREGDPPVDVTDGPAVREAIAAAQPDAVYHLAAVSHVGHSWNAPATVFRVNAEGTLNVLRACEDASVGRALVVGSADQYGTVEPGDLPIHESQPPRPVTPYGASKVAADVLALQSFLATGLATIRVRAFNHTGPGQDDRFVVPGLARRIAAAERDGTSEIAVGSLHIVRDLGDVRDVVRAYRLLVERGTPGAAYNVCTGRGVSVAEIGEMLAARSTGEVHLAIDPALVRPVEVPTLIGDPSTLREATGWAPLIPLEQTAAEVLAVARSNLRRRA